MSAQQQAEDLLVHYFKLAFDAAGKDWDSDYGMEVGIAVGHILAAADERTQEMCEEIVDLKRRVQTLVSVLAAHLTSCGEHVSAKSVLDTEPKPPTGGTE